MLSVDAEGRAFIEREEGVVLHWYRDEASIPTIGCGHRILPGEPYVQGSTITREQADAMLSHDTRIVESCVRSFTIDTIGQNMFNAMCSLGFNIGAGAERVSSVAKLMSVGGYSKAADAFLLWDKAVIGGVLQVSPRLAARRARERALFMLDVERPTLDDLFPSESD